MKYIYPAFVFLLPGITFAAPRSFKELVDSFLGIIEILVIFIFALTFLVLVWGIVQTWILHAGDQKELEKGKNIVLYGIIGLVVMSSIWGIVALLKSSLFGN